MASCKHILQWQWPVERWYVEEFKSYSWGQVALYETYKTPEQGVEQISNHLHLLFEPFDYAQFQSATVRIWGSLYAAKISDWVSTVLQNKSKFCFVNTS